MTINTWVTPEEATKLGFPDRDRLDALMWDLAQVAARHHIPADVSIALRNDAYGNPQLWFARVALEEGPSQIHSAIKRFSRTALQQMIRQDGPPIDRETATVHYLGRTFEITVDREGVDYWLPGVAEIVDGKREWWDSACAGADCLQEAFASAMQEIIFLVDSDDAVAEESKQQSGPR